MYISTASKCSPPLQVIQPLSAELEFKARAESYVLLSAGVLDYVRLEVSLDLASRLPAGAVHVSESGIETAEDMHRLRAAGFHAFLIGESLMRRPDPGSALESLLLAAPVSK